MNQNTVQNSKAFVFGSGKVEVGATEGTLVNLGTMNNVAVRESWDLVTVMGGNVGEITKKIKNQKMTLTGDLMEIVLGNLDLIRGGIDTYSTVAAAPVAVTGEAHGTGWTQGLPIKLNYKNGAGTIVTSITVKGAGSGLVANTDYRTYVGNGSNGEIGASYIVPITTQAGAITVDYTYTPSASKVLESGGLTTITPKIVRVTNLNEAGAKFEVTIWKASNTGGIEIPLNNDDADDPTAIPITLEGVNDTTLTAGHQLYKIINEQEV